VYNAITRLYMYVYTYLDFMHSHFCISMAIYGRMVESIPLTCVCVEMCMQLGGVDMHLMVSYVLHFASL